MMLSGNLRKHGTVRRHPFDKSGDVKQHYQHRGLCTEGDKWG
jgi:hypothetical protein